jgi:hypothetical protein
MYWKPAFSAHQKAQMGQLWVTAVGGIALVIVIQTFGQDWGHWRAWTTVGWSGIDWTFTLDRWIRYGLALWFEIYMVLAFLANEARPSRSWVGPLFDVIQSVLTFAALGMLGFVTQDFDVLRDRVECARTMAFAAILVIALWTLITHHFGERAAEGIEFHGPLQWVRLSAVVTSCIAIGFVWCHSSKLVVDVAVLFFVLASLIELYVYSVFAFRSADAVASAPK